MKPLVPALLSLLLCSAASLRAQTLSPDASDSLKELKKKYVNGGQKPVIKEAPAAETAPIPEGAGIAIADLEALLLKSPDCAKNTEDTAELAAELKGKYGLVACRNEIDGLRAIVLVPKSASAPGQQLQYGSVVGAKLLHARLVDHYLVLQFDKQVQYLDLLKQDKGPDGKESGFSLAGFFADDSASRFGDAGILVDALKTYAGVRDQELLSKVPGLTAKIVNGKRFSLSASRIKGDWTVIVTSGGEASLVWPQKKNP